MVEVVCSAGGPGRKCDVHPPRIIMLYHYIKKDVLVFHEIITWIYTLIL